jgi:hypothetical protein
MLKTSNLIILALGIFLFLLSNQILASVPDSSKLVVYEKVYLHIDREFYSPGDTIWFKAYLTSGIAHKLIPGYKNIYVQLVSPLGKIEANRVLLSMYGESFGEFPLPDTIPEGQYTVRATTLYQENFGEEAVFHKRILVSKPKSSLELDFNSEPPAADVMFFPEGGHLVAGAANYVAFKAFGKDGKGVGVTGKIVDESGNEVTSFKTSYLGMGQFVLKPEDGKSYSAKIDGLPDFTYKFENIAENGVALHFQDKAREVIVSVARGIKVTGSQTYLLTASHKGTTLFTKSIAITGTELALRLGKNLFPLGITKLTLTDTASNIVAERLVYIDDNYGNTVSINLGKDEFVTRENVSVQIEPLLEGKDSLLSSLSVSVVNMNYFGKYGNSQTIKSYLLLDSELKGAIESPASFFIDDDTIASSRKIDLLMMVQGWRNYFWDDILEKMPSVLKGWDDAGISVAGYVKHLFRNKPVIKGEVKFGPYTTLLNYEHTRTDSAGRFEFKRLYLKDSAKINITARTAQNKITTQIIPDTVKIFRQYIDPSVFKPMLVDFGIPLKYYRGSYFNYMASKEFNPELGSILLDEIEKTAERITPNEKFYEMKKPYMFEPDKSFTITKDDYNFTDMFDYLRDKPTGFIIDGRKIVSIKGIKVLYYLDGVMIDPDFVEDLFGNLRMNEIYKIEILKNTALLSIYGSQNIDIAVQVFTRWDRDEFERLKWGKTTVQVEGFRKPAQFYSPKYTLENIHNPEPDFRPTLFWSPSVRVIEGKASAEFFTCDNLANYIIFVEGISKEGRILFGSKQFSVANFNSAAQN